MRAPRPTTAERHMLSLLSWLTVSELYITSHKHHSDSIPIVFNALQAVNSKIISTTALHRTLLILQGHKIITQYMKSCYTLHIKLERRTNACFLLSWWFPLWASIQHHRQAPWLGNGLLGSRDHVLHHSCWILPDAQHSNQDGSRVQEGRLKHCHTSSVWVPKGSWIFTAITVFS